MKALILSLFVFATVFALSSAFTETKGKEHRKGLVDYENEKTLQKRKPPGKVPGPKLREEPDPEFLVGIFNDKDVKKKHLSDTKIKRKDFVPLEKDAKDNNTNKPKDKHLVNMNRNEETQEEKNTEV